MHKFNLVLAAPGDIEQYPHTQCFLEVAQLLRFGLRDLGHTVLLGTGFREDCWNLVLGYHFFFGKPLPKGYPCIVYQLEQLENEAGWPPNNLETLRTADVVWDYSERNIDLLATQGIDAVHKPLGFHPQMKQIEVQPSPPIDILFYGSMNERRMKLLKQLTNRFKIKVLFGVYGAERDRWIGQAKLVLLVHYYETKLFDEVRLSYLMNNKVFTVVEDTQYRKYDDLLVFSDYDELEETCEFYVKRDQSRKELAARAYAGFSQYPETEFLRKAISQL